LIAAKAAPDRYTFLASANPALSVNPTLYKNFTYSAERDFVPVARGVRRRTQTESPSS